MVCIKLIFSGIDSVYLSLPGSRTIFGKKLTSGTKDCQRTEVFNYQLK